MALNAYLQQVQRLVGDVKEEVFNLDDLKVFVNLAREQVAAQGECVRWLTPSSAGVASIAPVAVGSGYTSATVAIAPPDMPGVNAVAAADIDAGKITSYTVTTPGTGYLYPPGITVSGDGTGATATPTLQYTSQALQEQESYQLSGTSALQLPPIPVTTLYPGAQDILAVLSIAVIWQNIRYVANYLSFSQFQAMVRSYTNPNFLYTPFWWTQYGQGTNGTFYIYPVPDQNYPVEIDTILLPADLVDDSSVELIPRPWRAAVPFYAAYLALLTTNEPQRVALAFRYFNETTGGIFHLMMKRARAFAQPRSVSSWYGRRLS